MVIPNTIFVAVGVITAASLTGIFSFIALINQKEGKVSEFRQNWIDALREDVAKFTSSFDRISTSWQLIQLQERRKATPFDGVEWIAEFNELSKEDSSIFCECHNRILLRLNKNKDKELINKLNKAKLSISDRDVMFDKSEIQSQIDDIINVSQDLLKIEWEVVKAGEKAYINTKRATKAIVTILLLSLLISYYFLQG
ncbi:hypothetical protein [Shewanella sp. UCD-KL12]|uniref:hypothetical protein n=1 Tax=Shewanella sp. UCD-KL12 TaxID=1917163 RepID=UPI000970697A|nr:hypothetical protein [Shewanella sp. UCD-KL12]